jgi:hypothetical protein
MTLHRFVLIVPLTLAVACASMRGGTPQTVDGVAISREARRALDLHFKRWEVAAVDPAAGSCAAAGAGSKVSAHGDFDGDGRADIALAVKTDNGVRLVVLLARAHQSDLFDIDSLGDSKSNTFLATAPRGGAFRTPTGLVTDFFSTDTVTTNQCGQSMTAFLWNGSSFLKTPIAPVNAQAGAGR